MQDSVEGQRIITNPGILCGKPVIRGTRISVEFIVALKNSDWTDADIMANYSWVTPEDILACLAYGDENV